MPWEGLLTLPAERTTRWVVTCKFCGSEEVVRSGRTQKAEGLGNKTPAEAAGVNGERKGWADVVEGAP